MAQLARFSPAAVVQRITRGGEALAEPAHTIDEIVDEATQHRPNLNAPLIRRAYETAVTAHEGQLRSSGEPYVTHPVAVTYYLATLQMDAETLAAALLHDVPEDTDFTLADIEKSFGREVTQLVDGVTKLSKFGSARTMEEQQAENIRKMFMAMAEDVRVVIIKLADRLHNMRTLEHLPPEKQERIARQTMEIYAPLAHRLGMWQIKWELEDLSFKYLEPEKYRQLVEMLADRRRAREGFVNKSIGILRKELEKVDIKAEISGRPKHLYSIAKKMERKGAEFTEIYDLNAIRVLVDDVKDCYAALGIVHSLWRPVPGQFDDYIAMPKANMYQSLHTAVIGPEAKPLEVQIRTYRMHEVAEAGIAAHWRYKEGSARRPQVRREARLGPQSHGLAARGHRSDRVRRGPEARRLPGPGLRVHAEGRRQGPAARRDAARLRLPDPHRRRPPNDRRQGQQPAGAARLPAAERRHRRDRDDEGRPRAEPGLAEHRPHLARAREDPRLVQAPAARREHHAGQGPARPRASAAGARDAGRDRQREADRDRAAVQDPRARRLLRRHRLRRDLVRIGRQQARDPRRRRDHAAGGWRRRRRHRRPA